MSYFKSAQPLPRPSWWTAEAVLSALQAGEPVATVCRRAAAECNGALTPKTLRADVAKWTNSASWGDQFSAALALLKPDGNGSYAIAKDWYDDFFAAMDEADGDIEAACELAGVDPKLVLAVSGDKRSKHYDDDFAERLRIAEAPVHLRIRKNVLVQAEAASPDGARIGMKVLENALPAMHGSTQRLEVGGTVDHRHAHAHSHVHRVLPAAVVEASARRQRVYDVRPALPAESMREDA